jgi:hypothetical protein
MHISGSSRLSRHCEEQRDEAIRYWAGLALDCFTFGSE